VPNSGPTALYFIDHDTKASDDQPSDPKARVFIYSINGDTNPLYPYFTRGDTAIVYVVAEDTTTSYYDIHFYVASSGGSGGGGSSGSATGTDQRVLNAGEVSYIGGANRVLTSVAISQRGWTSAGGVILAPGDDSHLIDALTVASLAGQEDIPILLVLNQTVSEEVYAEIQRLGATKVYSVGWLGQRVADQVGARLPGVTREVIQGRDRVETADLIKTRITSPQGIFVIGYNAVADAVSAASYAASNRWIIQIARPDGSFTGGGGLSGHILGGPALVRDIAGLTRIYGADRYATNIALLNALNYRYEYLYITNGRTLVDGLTGAPLAGRTNAFILLVPNNDPTGVKVPHITNATQIVGLGAR
jgi:putative cell wall-binding protein